MKNIYNKITDGNKMSRKHRKWLRSTSISPPLAPLWRGCGGHIKKLFLRGYQVQFSGSWKWKKQEDNLKAERADSERPRKVTEWNGSGQFAGGKSRHSNVPRITAVPSQRSCSATSGSHFSSFCTQLLVSLIGEHTTGIHYAEPRVAKGKENLTFTARPLATLINF